MFTGTAEQLRQREERAQQIAQKIVDLLAEADTLGIGSAQGEISLPGASIHRRGDEWTVAISR
ncbi:hypothetical protein ACWGDE_24840 [Streptomyces sp. NPDC054956]